jgi:DNA-binding NtrC family response regulator
MQRLREHDWPGNVRELRNLLQRMTILAPGSIATPSLLECCGLHPPAARADKRLGPLADMESDHIARVLGATGWHKARAAVILGISRPTLDRKIRQYKLERPNAP